MSFTALCHQIFPAVIDEYHRYDDVDHPIANPYREGSIEHLLYLKNWIDTVQWHLEDLIRDPQIDPVEALVLKRRIDRSNQERTDMAIESGAKINTESPAWAIDRLSILALKIYHMAQEVKRTDVSAKHVEECRRKLDILLQQRTDLTTAIEELLADMAAGHKYMKVYKQMKMYNDPELNPVLYAAK